MPGPTVTHTADIRDTYCWDTRPRAEVWRGLLILLFISLVPASSLIAQSSVSPGQDSAPSTAAQTSSPQKLPRVTTTVEVHDQVTDDYLSGTATAASLDGALLKETPLSVTSVSRAVLSDQVARVLSDVVKNDASVSEDYAPVGYYGDFEIRGFPIDLGSGLQINGMTIAGEQDVPLENKESVEFV